MAIRCPSHRQLDRLSFRNQRYQSNKYARGSDRSCQPSSQANDSIADNNRSQEKKDNKRSQDNACCSSRPGSREDVDTTVSRYYGL
jgi:hypothetical protein